MKKVLYFFPDHMGVQTAGNKTRAVHLLKYFAHKGYHVDFVGLLPEREEKGMEGAAIGFLKNNKLADNVHLLNRKPGKANPVWYFLRYKLWDLFYYWFTFPASSNIPTFITIKLKRAFEEVLRANQYDYIIVSYVFYANLISNKHLLKGAKTFIDTHDFITAQFKGKRGFNLGATLADEINRLNAFDEVWAISPEEQYVFNQFCKSRVRLVPMMMDAPPVGDLAANERNIDLIYVASDNIHNQKATKWFFDCVYPLLPAGLNICVIGKINKYIPDHYQINRVLFAEQLDTYYNNSKIAICPMLSGTGVKVKVVEALSYGLPVVCTTNGTDGLLNKTDNGCLVSNDPNEFASLIEQLLSDEQMYQQQRLLAKKAFLQSFETTFTYQILDKAFN